MQEHIDDLYSIPYPGFRTGGGVYGLGHPHDIPDPRINPRQKKKKYE